MAGVTVAFTFALTSPREALTSTVPTWTAVNVPAGLPLPLTVVITMNANDFYQRTRNDNSAVIYPITVGNIKILSNKYVAGSSQTYPTNELFTYCNGDLSFNFVKTE